jgi:hypothetical protein
VNHIKPPTITSSYSSHHRSPSHSNYYYDVTKRSRLSYPRVTANRSDLTLQGGPNSHAKCNPIESHRATVPIITSKSDSRPQTLQMMSPTRVNTRWTRGWQHHPPSLPYASVAGVDTKFSHVSRKSVAKEKRFCTVQSVDLEGWSCATVEGLADRSGGSWPDILVSVRQELSYF